MRAGRGRSDCLTSIQKCIPVDESRGQDFDQDNDPELPSTDIKTVITRLKEILLERKFGLPQPQLVKKYESVWNEKLSNIWDKDEVKSQFSFEKIGALTVVKIKVINETQQRPETSGNGQIEKIVQEKLECLDVQSVVR